MIKKDGAEIDGQSHRMSSLERAEGCLVCASRSLLSEMILVAADSRRESAVPFSILAHALITIRAEGLS